jgi:hypothetical protein
MPLLLVLLGLLLLLRLLRQRRRRLPRLSMTLVPALAVPLPAGSGLLLVAEL